MQSVKDGVWWCDRCGTLKIAGNVPEFEAPSLVSRADALVKLIDNEGPPAKEWQAIGTALDAVRESCRKPDDRWQPWSNDCEPDPPPSMADYANKILGGPPA